MSRAPTTDVIPGLAGLSVGLPESPAPRGWKWVKLTDVARLESGHTPSRRHPEYWDGSVPWLTLPDARVHHGRVISETSQTISKAGLANSAARLLPVDTVCLSRTASVGNVTRLGCPMATSQDFVNWVCSPALDPRFLLYAILSEGEHLLAFGRGTTHTTIYFPEVLAFHICMPERRDQERIVEKVESLLSQVTSAREHLNRVREILKRFRQSVLAAACSGRLTAEWRETDTSSETAADLIESVRRARTKGKRSTPMPSDEAGDLPDTLLPGSWTWCRIGEIASVCLGGTPSRNVRSYWGGSIPWVSSGEVANCRISATREMITAEGRDNSNAKIYPPGTVLIAMIGEGKTRGQAAILDIAACTNQNAAGLVFEPDTVCSEYVWYWALGEYQKNRSIGRGGNYPALNGAKVRALPVPLPPREEQREIVCRVTALLAAADVIERRLAAAETRSEALPRAVLTKAFRGELLPPDAEVTDGT